MSRQPGVTGLLVLMGILAILIAVAPCGAQDTPKKPSDDKIRNLEQKQKALLDTVKDLEKEIAGLKDREAGEEDAWEKPAGKEADIKKRKAFQDRQTAAPRLDDHTLNPQYRGFIPIPNTRAMIRFNAMPRVDVTWDNGQGNKDRFVPARFPVRGDGSGDYDGKTQFNINSKATNLRCEIVAPNIPGNPRFYYQNDFFGSGDNEYEFRVQHMYGQVYNLIAGQTFSIFEDPDVWPDTVDYEGPNSMIWSRRPLIHYMVGLCESAVLTFGIEQPNGDVPGLYDGSPTPATDLDVDTYSRYPDAAAQIRVQDKDTGHIELAAIVREIGADSDRFGKDEVVGYGGNLSGSLQLFDSDVIVGQVTYGKGIGRFGNDTSFEKADAAFDTGGHLKALRYFAGMVGITHNWSPQWRSTVSYGYVKLGNEATQGPWAYEKTQYVSGNLVVNPFEELRNVAMGVEVLWGTKETANGNRGRLVRVQFGIRYSIF